MTALQYAEQALLQAAADLFDAVMETGDIEASRHAWMVAQSCERAVRDVTDIAGHHHDLLSERIADPRRAS